MSQLEDDLEPQQQSDGGGLRRQLEEALRAKREAEQALQTQVQEAEQRGAVQAQRRFEALRIFGEDKPKLAEQWVRDNPDTELTKEAAASFASQFGVKLEPEAPAEPAAPAVPPEVVQAAQAFQQAAPAGGGTDTMLTREEFDQMMADPARRGEAIRASQEGRVKLNNPEVLRQDHRGPGLPL